MVAPEKELLKGGSFLLTDTQPEQVYSPEDFSEEHRMIAQTTMEYIEKEVIPNSQRIEEKDYELQRELLRKAGELGLLAASVPETYGGLALDQISAMLISEHLTGQGSFVTTFGATASIGTLPIVYFGTDEQKKKYLPKLATGEWVGAYCLSESGSGSDALAAKTTARLNAEGTHWVLNGEKMWISNGAFADVYTIFAKVDGEKFSAFIVERNDPGVSSGAEEHKMGQRGSSTTPVLLADCKIPKDRLLGEIGKGHVHCLQHSQLWTYQAGRWRNRRIEATARPRSKVRLRAAPVRYDDWEFWRDQIQAGRDAGANVCWRICGLSHSRNDRGSRGDA